MSFFSLRNILIFGILLLLLIGIPVGIYLAQQQQQTQSQAEQSSVLSFEPVSSEADPIPVVIGEDVKLNLKVDPGANSVSVVAFEINYDPTKVKPADTEPFLSNETNFPVVLDTPIFEDGIIRGRVSTGGIDKAVTTPTTVATFTFTALEATTDSTQVSFGTPFTQILSASGSDEASENVLSSTTPAFLAITAAAEPTGELEPTGTNPGTNPTIAPTAGPAPTSSPGSSATNKPPVCTSLTSEGALTGTIPFTTNLTTVGSDSDGGVTKATFNFGDGQTADAFHTGTGAASASATINQSHTYTTAGTHRTSVLFTDNQDGVSEQGSCVLTFNITNPPTPTTELVQGEPEPTLEPTGPRETFIGIGIIAGILTFLGGLLFFSL